MDKALYKEIYSAMNACNSSGLINSMPRWVEQIRAEGQEVGDGSTDYINRHPLIVILADKLISLAGYPDILDAYRVVRERAQK